MTVILGTASSAQNVGHLSALAVGGYIAGAGLWADPLSGASMNPVRSLAPIAVAGRLPEGPDDPARRPAAPAGLHGIPHLGRFPRPVTGVRSRGVGLIREHIIGTEVKVDYRNGRLVRRRHLIPIDKGPGKPAHLWDRAGGTALFAAGDTTGDLEMLESARFGLLIVHDDAHREYGYDDPRAVAAATENGWVLASMRDDFAEVFSATE